MKKIFITGAGVVSAIGVGKEANWNSLSANQSGIGEVRYLNTVHHEFPVGEVKMSNEEMKRLLGIPVDTIISRAALLGILAVKEAVEEARVEEQQLALISGTTVGGMDLTEEVYPDSLTADTMPLPTILDVLISRRRHQQPVVPLLTLLSLVQG